MRRLVQRPALFIAIDTPRRKDDQGPDIRLHSQQLACVGLVVGDGVDQSVDAGSHRPGDGARIVPIDRQGLNTINNGVGVGRAALGADDAPTVRRQRPGRGAADLAGAADDQSLALNRRLPANAIRDTGSPGGLG